MLQRTGKGILLQLHLLRPVWVFACLTAQIHQQISNIFGDYTQIHQQICKYLFGDCQLPNYTNCPITPKNQKITMTVVQPCSSNSAQCPIGCVLCVTTPPKCPRHSLLPLPSSLLAPPAVPPAQQLNSSRRHGRLSRFSRLPSPQR